MTQGPQSPPRIWATLHPFFEGGAVLGRTVANTEFLRALLRADPFDAYHFFLIDQKLARNVHTRLKAEFPAIAARDGFLCGTRHQLAKALQSNEYQCFHLSDSVTGQAFLGRLRNALARNIFPITGITHSLSYAQYPEKFLEHLWQGTTRRDAIVATSQAGKSVVEAVFAGLRRNFGLNEKTFPAPMVPVVPLGVTPMFTPGGHEHATLRALARERLGAAENETVFLAFARLSHYSKMDLMPLLFALQRAEALGLPKSAYTLVVAGQDAPGDGLSSQLRALAANAGIRLRIELSPDDTLKAELFAAADVFVSPVDNIQETFGITLIEAASAGLPVVASDFDGYRDIVVHEKTGLLVPTLAPARTPEQNMLAPLLGDNQYHLELAQQTVVDVAALAQALTRLGTDAALRREMAANARARCDENYVWPKVIDRWLALWEQLRNEPADAAALRDLSHPLEMNFGEYFAAYPSHRLDEPLAQSLTVRQSRRGRAVYREQDFPVMYTGVAEKILLPALRRLLVGGRKSITIKELRAQLLLEHLSAEAADFIILWACKQDLLELCPPEETDATAGAALPEV